nr:hypothetical protein BaRGS_033366 [Batillaria attramentaria]
MANESILTVLVPGNWSHDGSVGHPAGGRKGDIVQGALLVAIATLGVILNVFLVLAILPNPRMRSVRQVLLVHLGLVGIVTSLVLTLPAGVLQLTAAFDASSTGRPPRQPTCWCHHRPHQAFHYTALPARRRDLHQQQQHLKTKQAPPRSPLP